MEFFICRRWFPISIGIFCCAIFFAEARIDYGDDDEVNVRIKGRSKKFANTKMKSSRVQKVKKYGGGSSGSYGARYGGDDSYDKSEDVSSADREQLDDSIESTEEFSDERDTGKWKKPAKTGSFKSYDGIGKEAEFEKEEDSDDDEQRVVVEDTASGGGQYTRKRFERRGFKERPIGKDMMKAVVLNTVGHPNVLRVHHIPIPTASKNQILVKVMAAGVNPVDAHLRSGTSYTKVKLPVVLGKEIAGTVRHIDEDVTGFKKDDRVFCGIDVGGYAEFAVANASNCYPLSEKLTFSQGASLYFVYFLIHRALITKGGLRMDELLFVHGASGSLGIAVIQVARDRGAKVIVSVKDKQTENLMYEAGADYVVYHEPEEDVYLEDALRHADREGFDIILEILKSVNLKRDKKFLAQRGRIILMGKSVAVDTGRQHLWTGESIVRTVSFFRYTQREQEAAAEYLLKAIERGNINPAIAREYKLEEAWKAHKELFYGAGSSGKLVLTPRRENRFNS